MIKGYTSVLSRDSTLNHKKMQIKKPRDNAYRVPQDSNHDNSNLPQSIRLIKDPASTDFRHMECNRVKKTTLQQAAGLSEYSIEFVSRSLS